MQSDLTSVSLSKTALWRTRSVARCSGIKAEKPPKFEAVLDFHSDDTEPLATADSIKKFIDEAVESVPISTKDAARQRLARDLVLHRTEETATLETNWRRCLASDK